LLLADEHKRAKKEKKTQRVNEVRETEAKLQALEAERKRLLKQLNTEKIKCKEHAGAFRAKGGEEKGAAGAAQGSEGRGGGVGGGGVPA
jgi:hypothetical protein